MPLMVTPTFDVRLCAAAMPRGIARLARAHHVNLMAPFAHALPIVRTDS